MKIIDQTPLLDANGQLNPINRIQGMLKYGLSWPANLEAQRKVIGKLNRAIEKGYTLFRNQKLGASEIIIPLILIGSSGIYVLDATPLKGFYRARGDEWGIVTNERFQPADEPGGSHRACFAGRRPGHAHRVGPPGSAGGDERRH
jgi:hypothetical protein